MSDTLKYKFLLLCADRYPPFRVDVAVLFGKEFAERGHEIHWILQSEGDCKKSYTSIWKKNTIYVGRTDNGTSTASRIKKYLFRTLHSIKMINLARKNHYDFIQVKDRFLSAVLAGLVAKLTKSQFFYWLSYPIPESNIYRYEIKDGKYYQVFFIKGLFLKLLLYKIILPLADHVFAQSEQMKRDLMDEGIKGDKITPVPMGIEIDDDQIDSDTPLKAPLNAEKSILYLGTMIKVRRLDFLLRVFKQVSQKDDTCKLYMVGGSDSPSDLIWLKEVAHKLGLKDRVVFTGNLPRNDAFEYVRKADVCLSPFAPVPILNSTSPTKLVEYFYWGKPTVANDHPEQKQVIDESHGGICVPYEENAFADAIITLLNDQELARKMGQNGRKYVLENRSYQIIATRLELRYSEILKTNNFPAQAD